ncbi:hypothetical protein PHJA_001820600 [Phtheirospermum japonicum]|uniref:Uncharacterized protein n=1 Tax=Phtheirospermum japonicum TaxID=374723 RepID=A0A830CNZ2_9LAMI|nr:hypothetical protein PHJA_001820600 [Phtheirospermum japonicum]
MSHEVSYHGGEVPCESFILGQLESCLHTLPHFLHPLFVPTLRPYERLELFSICLGVTFMFPPLNYLHVTVTMLGGAVAAGTYCVGLAVLAPQFHLLTEAGLIGLLCYIENKFSNYSNVYYYGMDDGVMYPSYIVGMTTFVGLAIVRKLSVDHRVRSKTLWILICLYSAKLSMLFMASKLNHGKVMHMLVLLLYLSGFAVRQSLKPFNGGMGVCKEILGVGCSNGSAIHSYVATSLTGMDISLRLYQIRRRHFHLRIHVTVTHMAIMVAYRSNPPHPSRIRGLHSFTLCLQHKVPPMDISPDRGPFPDKIHEAANSVDYADVHHQENGGGKSLVATVMCFTICLILNMHLTGVSNRALFFLAPILLLLNQDSNFFAGFGDKQRPDWIYAVKNLAVLILTFPSHILFNRFVVSFMKQADSRLLLSIPLHLS